MSPNPVSRIIPLIAAIAGLTGCAPTLEFRAEVDCVAGQQRIQVQMSHKEICISPDRILDDSNVVAVRSVQNARIPHTVSVTFDAAGQKRFSSFTDSHVGKSFAILVDGKVMMDPMIAEPISGGSAVLLLTPEGEVSLLKRFHAEAAKP